MDLELQWRIVAFFIGVVAIPSIGWAIRIGLASKADLARETTARSTALVELEGRIAAKLAEAEDSRAELSDRTLRIETEIRHLPSADDIADLKGAIIRTEARLEGLEREILSVARSLARIEDNMLGAKK
jgi:septal ring factor EnvC (AmiA/AmiB activator)